MESINSCFRNSLGQKLDYSIENICKESELKELERIIIHTMPADLFEYKASLKIRPLSDQNVGFSMENKDLLGKITAVCKEKITGVLRNKDVSLGHGIIHFDKVDDGIKVKFLKTTEDCTLDKTMKVLMKEYPYIAVLKQS